MVMLNPRHDLSLSIRQQFMQFYPELVRLLRWVFRGENPDQRSESVSEAIAFAFYIFKTARENGKDVGVHPLARYASLHMMAGERLAGSNRKCVESRHGHRQGR